MILKVVAASVVFGAALFAASPMIGLVTANGSFTLDGATVSGNATLPEGAKLETGDAPSVVALSNGVTIQLEPASSANVSEGYLELTKGIGQVTTPEPYEVRAGGFSVRSRDAGRIRVQLANGKVEVNGLAGVTAVINAANGRTVGSLTAGERREFEVQEVQSVLSHSGCLLFKDNRYILQDQATQEVFEVVGSNLGSNMGNQVTVNGSVVPNARSTVVPASSIINAASVVQTRRGGCLTAAIAIGALVDVAGPRQ
jgi:hypothetical protein